MSKINFEDFCAKFAQALEIENPSFADVDFSDVPQYDSMGKISASLLIEEQFGFQIPFEVLDKQKNILELYTYCLNHQS
jgi:acyl carrier protein